MKTKDEILNFLSRHKQEFAVRFSVRRIGLFGSIIRDEGSGESDLDILVEMDQQKLPLDLQMMGEAVGSYSLDGDRIRVTALDHSDLAFEAFLDGDSMMKTLVANEFAPLFVTAYPVAQFECSETTLSLTILEQPGLTAPIEFERVSQD